MLTQQNLMDEGSQGRIGLSAPVIDKIEYQSNRIKNLISHLRMNKRRSSGQVTMTPFNIQNQCQISNIQPISQKLDRNSFQLQLQNEITIKRNTITMTPIIMKNKSLDKQGIDKGLKYKPRGAVNGRDDIRVRNLNQIHKKIIGSLDKKRNQYSPGQKQQQKLQYTLNRLEQQDNPQNNNQIFGGNQSKLKLTNSILKKKQSFTQRIINPNKLSDSRHKKFNQNQEKFLIQPKQLLKYLQKINFRQQPTSDCSPTKIYQFFTRIANNFGIENQFNQPLIKRYKNCIYFGHKVSQVFAYIGFVWYFRKALYYGEFQKGRKNGYGIQIDLEQKDNWCLWKGTFLNGKKTGYFQMLSPKLQYNGSLVNSYFEGQGMLKMNNYSIYKGIFHAGMKHGYGVQNFINKKSLCYKGEYSQNKFQGKGQLQGPNYYYKGTFRNSKVHGEGFERTDQFEYQGQFKNGKKSGCGILKLRNGQQYNGIFENGQLIRQTNKNQQKQENAKYINNNMFRNNQYIKSIKIQSANKYKLQNSMLMSPILLEQSPIKSPNSKSIEQMAKNLHLPLYNKKSNNNSQLKKIKKESSQASNNNINVSHYSSRIVPLQKNLSKRLKSLYQQNQNQEGTIDQSNKYQINQYQSKYQRNNKSNRIQDTKKYNYNLTNFQRDAYDYRSDANQYKKIDQNQNNQNIDDEQQPLQIKILPKV